MNCSCILFESHVKKALTGFLSGLFLSLFFLVTATSVCAEAQPLLSADKISYNEKTETVTASGNVEFSKDSHVLRANKITYNKKTDVVRAEGNVALLSQKSGEILFAKELEVTSDMKDGFLSQVGLLFPDDSRLVASTAEKYEGRYLIAERGVYSACHLCKDNPKAAPLWQVSAARVTHDSEARDVMYRDAMIEVFGLPVFYMPYFSHPDPMVRRRQGLLTPVVGVDSTLGPMARLPYYIDIAPNTDLLVTPTFSEEDKLQLEALWRHNFTNGKMELEGSVVNAVYTDDTGQSQGKKWRGHLFGKALFNVTNKWRVGTQLAYASDKGYLNRYKISSQDLLVNRLYAEYFKGRDYAVGDLYYFQDMRPGTRLAEPIVAPEIRYSALGEPGQTWGGRWSLNTSLLVTQRERLTDLEKQGPSTRRLAVDAGWQRQIISKTGFLTTISGLVRGDAYWADNVASVGTTASNTNFSSVTRLRPFIQGDISLRYPLGRHGDGYEQILEPIAILSLAPHVNNTTRLPNEDSLDVEFDETNLFSSNRFSGVDHIEGGTRAAYGLRHALFGKDGERIEMLVGQVFRLEKDEAFTESSGLHHNFSDYVGRIDFMPADWFDMNYGFRLDQRDVSVTRQEFQASVGKPFFRPYLNYLSLRQTEGANAVAQKIEEATAGFSSKLTRYWSFSAGHKQAMAPTPGPRSTGFNLTYQDECFKSELLISRDYTKQVDVESGYTVLLNIYMKNLGGINANY